MLHQNVSDAVEAEDGTAIDWVSVSLALLTPPISAWLLPMWGYGAPTWMTLAEGDAVAAHPGAELPLEVADSNPPSAMRLAGGEAGVALASVLCGPSPRAFTA